MGNSSKCDIKLNGLIVVKCAINFICFWGWLRVQEKFKFNGITVDNLNIKINGAIVAKSNGVIVAKCDIKINGVIVAKIVNSAKKSCSIT